MARPGSVKWVSSHDIVVLRLGLVSPWFPVAAATEATPLDRDRIRHAMSSDADQTYLAAGAPPPR